MDRSASVRARGKRARAAIKALAFDFDHTLGIDNKLERVAFLRLLEPQAPLVEEIEHVDALLAQQRSGAFTIEQAVERFVRERGVKDVPAYVGRYKRLCSEMVEAFVIPEPGARELCAQLHSRNIPHAILTNGWSPLQQRKAACVGFRGAVLVSSDIGTQKPSPQAFAALEQCLAVGAGEIAFVGDTPESDVAGSQRAGMFAVWYDAQRQPYPAALPPPAATIHTLSEALEIL
ncbi:MAG: HAD family hydrolase [Candidatus Baltobacteraceae bacterium]